MNSNIKCLFTERGGGKQCSQIILHTYYTYLHVQYMFIVCKMDGFFFRDGSMNIPMDGRRKFMGPVAKKAAGPLNFTQYPTKESAENGHCIPNLATPSTPCYRILKKPACHAGVLTSFTSSHLSDEDLELCRTSVLMVRRNCCDVDSPETWSKFHSGFSYQKRVRTHRQQKEKTHIKNNYEDIMKT